MSFSSKMSILSAGRTWTVCYGNGDGHNVRLNMEQQAAHLFKVDSDHRGECSCAGQHTGEQSGLLSATKITKFRSKVIP